jgi:hypothetical protein
VHHIFPGGAVGQIVHQSMGLLFNAFGLHGSYLLCAGLMGGIGFSDLGVS